MDLVADYLNRITLPGELKRWAWQRDGVVAAERLMSEEMATRCCITVPTGGGKTLMMTDLAGNAVTDGTGAAVFTNRRIIAGQIERAFERQGYEPSLMMSDKDHRYQFYRPIHVCLLDTVYARCIRSKKWALPDVGRIIVDEAHMQKAGMMQAIIESYPEAHVIGFSATPVGISHLYSRLIQPANNQTLRDAGALVPADYIGGTEFDTKQLKRSATGEFAYGPKGMSASKADRQFADEPDNAGMLERVRERRYYTSTLFKNKKVLGHIVRDWLKHNPQRQHGLCMAPGVAESIFLCNQFNREGIKAAQIDGLAIRVDGQQQLSTQDNRDELFERTKPDGDIEVLCSAFVLREGFDAPWLRVLSLATPIGSFKSYLQTIGRILRASPSTGKERATIIDHGGNWWRHGPPQRNVDWQHLFELRENFASEFHYDQIRNGHEREPIRCGKCGHIRGWGAQCHKCGTVSNKQERELIQLDGELVKLNDKCVPLVKRQMRNDTEKKWIACYLRCEKRNPHFTFRQVEGLFVSENYYYPPRGLPFMPLSTWDWWRPINSVSKSELVWKES